MSAPVMPEVFKQFLDDNAAPLASGTVEFYAAGTSTPKNTYSDQGLTVPNPNPITLNAGGRPEVSGSLVSIYWAAGAYKVVLKNALGVTIDTRDNIAGASIAPTILSKTASYAVVTTDGDDVLVLVDATAGAVTISIYTAVGNAGKRVSVKKIDASANAVTVDPNGSETIDGLSTVSLTRQYQGIGLQSDNANWTTIGLTVMYPTGAIFATSVTVSGALTAGSGAVGAVAVAVGNAAVGLYSAASNVLAMVTNGVAALVVNAQQFISSATQPRCVAYHNTTQTIGSDTALSLNSEDVDVGAMHDPASNNSRVTIPTGGDGYYDVEAYVSVDDSGSSGDANISIRKGGSTKLVEHKVDSSVIGSAGQAVTPRWKGNLVAGDYLEIFVDKSDGSNWTYGSGNRERSTSLSVVKLW